MFKRKCAAVLTAAVCACGVLGSFPSMGLSSGPSLARAADGELRNPIIWADVPDVDVIAVGDTYYMVSTTMYFAPGAPIMKSKDLVSWEICNYVYDTLADAPKQNLENGEHDYAHGQWAASLREHDGTFYVFFGSYGTGKSYIYKTDDIENGSWTRSEIDGMYHDASLLFDDDGRNYLVYGGNGEISIKELNAEMTGFQPGGVSQVLLKTGLDGLAGEGSHVQKIGDYYYVFLIAWPSNSGRIELCCRSKDLLGNYEMKTVLNSGGVAQGGIVQTPSGDWYGMLFQDHGAVGRVPVLVPVTWQDDWPVMGVDGKAPTTLEMPDSYTGAALAKSDDFTYDANKLALEWQWNHNPDNAAWSVTERAGWLRLSNAHLATNLLNARNTLTMRTEGPNCQSAIKLDASGMLPGDRAGLAAFQFNYGQVGVRVDDSGGKYVYMAKNGAYSDSAAITDSVDTIVEETPLSSDTVYLKEDFQFSNVDESGNIIGDVNQVSFSYSLDGTQWTTIGDTISMTYDLKLFTGYRSAIYSYPTTQTGGHADIDSFTYTRAAWNEPAYTGPDADGYFFHSTYDDAKGLDSWAGRGSAKVALSADTAYSGAQSLAVTGRESAWNGTARKLSSAVFTPGEAFTFSADVCFLDGAANDTFYLKLQYDDENGETQYATVAEATVLKGKWAQLKNTAFTIPEGATNLYIYVETAASTLDFYVDEAIGAPKGTEIAGPTGGTLLLGDGDGDGKITARDLSLCKRGLLYGGLSEDETARLDVDGSGEVTAADAVWLAKFLTVRETGYPEKTPDTGGGSDYEYQSEVPYHAIPDSYRTAPAQAGRVEKFSFGGSYCNVYLPYGYDENDASKRYNIFYLMHGGGENQDTIFSDDVNLDIILDNMIANGDIEPMIVCTPTFNNTSAETFHDEFMSDVMPAVEEHYHTYAKSGSQADLKASRMHRAYGGFSMGALTTWYVFMHCLDYVAYFMPLSGDNWAGTGDAGKAQVTAQAAIDSGYAPDEYFIFGATGTDDIAYTAMNGQMQEMKKLTDQFIYTADFSKGNFYFLTCEGATHWWGAVVHYVYDALPNFFHEGQ